MLKRTRTTFSSLKAQYTPPTPTQLNCGVESRRRCELNWQLVGDSLDESRRVWTICRQRSRVALCRRCERTSRQSWPSFQFSAPVTGCKIVYWVTTADGRVHTADTTQLDSHSQHVQFPNVRRQSSWASCEFNTHRRRRHDADATQLGVYWALPTWPHWHVLSALHPFTQHVSY